MKQSAVQAQAIKRNAPQTMDISNSEINYMPINSGRLLKSTGAF